MERHLMTSGLYSIEGIVSQLDVAESMNLIFRQWLLLFHIHKSLSVKTTLRDIALDLRVTTHSFQWHFD